MTPKPHLAALVAEWESLGVPIEEQQAAAPWAFVVPVVVAEPGCMELPEDQRIGWNEIGAPVGRERPRPPPSPAEKMAFLCRQLEEYAMLPG